MNESIAGLPRRPKRRILLWTELFTPHVGGIERFAEELVTALQPRGYQFAMITGVLKGSPEEEVHRGIEVCRLPLQKGLSGSASSLKICLEKIRELKGRFQPHLSHLNTHGPSFLYHLMTGAVAPHPTLFTFHFDVTPGLSRESLGKILSASDRVTAVSQDTLNKALQAFPEISEKSSVIYNGRALPPERLGARPVAPVKFLCWGRLAQNKGFDVALRAFARVAKTIPGARLVLAGRGPERPALEGVVSELGLQEIVHMPGYLDEEALESELETTTAVLVPSIEQECFGLVALEAMQRSKPVIASRYGGLTEVVADGRSGILVTPGNVDELAAAMTRLATDPDLALKMGEAGRCLAREKFSLEKMADRYEALYRSLCEKAKVA